MGTNSDRIDLEQYIKKKHGLENFDKIVKASKDRDLFDFYCSKVAKEDPEIVRQEIDVMMSGEGTRVGVEAKVADDAATAISEKRRERAKKVTPGETCFEFAGRAKAVTRIIQKGMEGGATVLEIMAEDGSKEKVREDEVVGFSVRDNETVTINDAGRILTQKGKKVPKGTKIYSLTKVLDAKQYHFSDIYEIVDPEVARGGMGKIMKVFDKAVGREVAMKVALMNREAMLQRFRFEARITGQLEHPNIIRVYDVGKDDNGNPYYTMEFIRGGSLDNILQKQKKAILARPGKKRKKKEDLENEKALKEYSLPKLLDIFLRVCDGVSYAHSKGVINRDLKPENVMVGSFGDVLVADLGLAKQLGTEDVMGSALEARVSKLKKSKNEKVQYQAAEEVDVGLTQDGTTMGTPAYMPPEQVEGELDQIDQQSDVYSLGGILYEILTKERPVEGASNAEIFNKILLGRIVPPSERVDEIKVPGELSAIAMKAMAVEKADRYQNVEELAEDIRAYSEHREVKAYNYTRWEKIVKAVKRHPVAAWAAGIGLFVALTAIAITGPVIYSEKAAKEAKAREAVEAKAGEAEALEEKLEAEKESSKNKELALQKSEEARVSAELAEDKALEAQKSAEGEAVALKAKADRAEAVSLKDQGNIFMEKSKKNHQRALEYYLKSCKADPSFPEAWNWIGHIKFSLARRVADEEKRNKLFLEAKSDLEKAIELDNNPEEMDKLRGRAQVNLADVYVVGLRDKTMGEKLYREAIAKSPDYITAYNKLARLLSSRKRYEEAMQNYKKITEISEDYWVGWEGLGYIHLKHGRLVEAEKCYRKAKKGHPESYYSLAEIKYRQADWQAANSFLTVLEDVLPDYKTEKRIKMQREVEERLVQGK